MYAVAKKKNQRNVFRIQDHDHLAIISCISSSDIKKAQFICYYSTVINTAKIVLFFHSTSNFVCCGNVIQAASSHPLISLYVYSIIIGAALSNLCLK